MIARGHFRGHPLIWASDRWVYEDDGAEIPANSGEIRPCIKCGSLFGEGEVDPCLGVLPGVDNACCGHGECSKAYVRFINGVVLKGFVVKRRRGKEK
ncbi:hypothetical protein LCGC14_1387360 [marine sediment metagenome]|uniref:Uncharacterized protein n=1 Tax=marine sediment metagenome TaxID=412755 RepID=A0A0F9N2H5_9ZZZZ